MLDDLNFDTLILKFNGSECFVRTREEKYLITKWTGIPKYRADITKLWEGLLRMTAPMRRDNKNKPAHHSEIAFTFYISLFDIPGIADSRLVLEPREIRTLA